MHLCFHAARIIARRVYIRYGRHRDHPEAQFFALISEVQRPSFPVMGVRRAASCYAFCNCSGPFRVTNVKTSGDGDWAEQAVLEYPGR